MNTYITVGGQGTRMKMLSPLDKHQLHYGNKTILGHLFDIFPNAILVGDKKTKSRKETLKELQGEEDCLIVDCDVIPYGCQQEPFKKDTIYAFNSEKNKYCSLLERNGLLAGAYENESITNIKASGVYFVKSIDLLLENMGDENSLASGMISADIKKEDTFLRVGDVEDYYEALGL
tara:strand:- start:2681 stop:3208 length:528 start_codon:yes stop_codon:yes gene_type:complete